MMSVLEGRKMLKEKLKYLKSMEINIQKENEKKSNENGVKKVL